MSLENTTVPPLAAGPTTTSIEHTSEFARSAAPVSACRSPSQESRRSANDRRPAPTCGGSRTQTGRPQIHTRARGRSSTGPRVSPGEDSSRTTNTLGSAPSLAAQDASHSSSRSSKPGFKDANAHEHGSGRSVASGSHSQQNKTHSSNDARNRKQRHKSKQQQQQQHKKGDENHQDGNRANADSDGADKPRRRRNRNRDRDRKGKCDKDKARGSKAAVGGGRMFDGTLTTDRDALDYDENHGGYASCSNERTPTADLSSTLAKRLTNSTYECMICCDKVRPRHATWQCDHCWAIFHIGCVKKWAKSCTGSDEDTINGRWRCPGCQYTRAAAPSHYVCFCGATRDPEFVRGTVPHSCGKICEKCRGPHCPHPCPLPCHPGPCPPCTALAPEQSCFCGRLAYRPRCGVDFDPVQGVKSCGEICGEMLGCGKHTCTKPCHPGLCPPCPREEEQMCYCGAHARTAKCGTGRPLPTFVRETQRGNELEASYNRDDDADGRDECSPQLLTNGDCVEPATGFYSCGKTCGMPLKCGVHMCKKPCHACPDPAQGHGDCPFDPSVATTCHCGAYLASDLGEPRVKCTDPIPSCGERCGHKLPGCSHTCSQTCHPGPCPPCMVKVRTTCRCGSKTFQVECHKARSSSSEQPRCQRVCSKMRACRRHQCSVRCCPSDHVDIDGVVIPSEDLEPGATDPHQCTLTCGRLLRCKVHHCAEPCHRGPCPPCLNASFDELACSCGRTRLMPPIPCGTTLPPCHHPCQRTRACGHVSLTTHECHPDNVPCPPCPVLVMTRCMCGNREMKNIPCHRSNAASCGNICNKLLPCGGHRCQRSCHRPDEPCLRGQPCRQACGKLRKTCGHPCTLLCHSPAMCDESKACDSMITVACECGRRSIKELCGATSTSPRNGMRKLACDEICKIALRNRRLALALNLNDRAEAPLAGLVKATYADDLLQFARANLAWVREIEVLAAGFIGDPLKPVMRFTPMKRAFRAFLHALGPFYGCTSRSIDREPLRSVCWERTSQATIPSIVLSSAIRYTHPPQIICSERVNASEDSDFDDSASHVFDNVAASTNPAADRLRRRIDYIALSDLRHGLTIEELEAEIRRLLPYAPLAIRWKNEDLVEVYCTDIEAKNENLMKWEAMLKSKLPHMGIAGSVVGEKVASPPPPQSSGQLPPIAPYAALASGCGGGGGGGGGGSTHGRTHSSVSVASSVMSAAKRIFCQEENEEDSVPEDWESLNIQEDDSTDPATDQEAGSVAV
ncbi:hypothetical protein GQ54DRAFT_296704 [Martensiomyces pterosporus]|nr:hypothetical protein GQ54DRAFT_296704 [Martensiomyces pterosporus]